MYALEKRQQRGFVALSLAVSLIAGLAFILFDIAWLKRGEEKNLADYERALIHLKEDQLRSLVLLVHQGIDIDRAQARIEAGAAVSEEEADEIAKERAKDRLRRLRTENQGYFWINQVLDYAGGDDYALRLVHPNLPETEGLLLSTELRDADGRLPYLIELEGVKKNGDVFSVYRFKKPGVDELGLKMSYAKLYRDFDWIIATGIYLDDVEAMVAQKRDELAQRVRGQFFIMAGFTLGILSLALFAIVRVGAWFLSRIAELAEKDGLTGLYARRAGQERLKQEVARSQRGGLSFCVLMCDIDLFKEVNDSKGHEGGDAVLVEAAKALVAELRAHDAAIRWGGEEFLLIINGADADAGLRVAERTRQRVATSPVRYRDEDLPLTVTIGVASYAPGDDQTSLVRRADEAMYRGKAAGRNRCVVEER
jgi:diguanylate cyclase (GGDEF)-like protein